MKSEYFLVDINKVAKYDFINNKKINIEELFRNLPEQYKKFVLCHNKGMTVRFFDTVQLGEPHNVSFFEFLSNHPFNTSFDNKNKIGTFYSATFKEYLQITNIYKNLEMINEEEVINFYKTLQDNNLFEDYTNFIYTIFTNAYDKSYPPVSKRLSLYRKENND